MAPDANGRRRDVKGQKRLVAAIVATLLLLLGGFGLLILDGQSAATRALDERFLTRATLTAGFTRDYVYDVAARERARAEQLLSGPEVDQATFEQVVRSFGFQAAVLLDEGGEVLHVWPRQPDLIGRDLAKEQPHLNAAIHGSVAISELVPSSGPGFSFTAIATPYGGPAGRRVLSGAFSLSETPLAAYFSNLVSLGGGESYLVDNSGNLLTSEYGARELPPELGSPRDGIAHISSGGERLTVATVAVDGAPWRVVLTVPSAEWYGTAAGFRWAPWALLAALAMAGVLVLMLVMGLGRARVEAAMAARTDALTGLPNRRAIDEVLARGAAHAARHGDPLSVLMIDLDHFKSINDRHGHVVGDAVLREAADVLRGVGRDEDVAGRWGGEEFLVVLQGIGIEGAITAAERLRAAIAAIAVDDGRAPVRVTASIGVAQLAEGGDPEALLRGADKALYRAKANGRNAVEVAGSVGRTSADRSTSLVASSVLSAP